MQGRYITPEVLWDIFADRRLAGGSPANVCYHATHLGMKTGTQQGVLISRVGQDKLGDGLVDFLEGVHVDTTFVQRDRHHPTGTVQVAIFNGEPEYTITDHVAWDHIAFSDAVAAIAPQADAVCFATLAQRAATTADTVARLLDAVPAHTLRIFDVNLRAPFYDQTVIAHSLERATVVKLNQRECDEIGAMFGQTDVSRWMMARFGVQMVCLTKGADGASLITPDGEISVVADAVDVSKGDAVGVGDAFLAALTTALLAQKPLREVLQFANSYAGMVATQKGAMPALEMKSPLIY